MAPRKKGSSQTFSKAGSHPEKKFTLQMSTQGKTARNRPISKVKMAKQMRRRRGVREDRPVSPAEAGTESGVEADSGIRDMRIARPAREWVVGWDSRSKA